jgi:hypothetical protein
MAHTPPADHLTDFASSGRSSILAPAKRKLGYNEGEAVSAEHLNFLFSLIGNWNKVTSHAMAPQIAANNIEYTTTSIGPTADVDNMHLDYLPLADRFYASGIDTAGSVFVTSSADGTTWETTQYPVNVGAGAYGDVSKVASNGTICAIAADNGTQAKVYTSSDLTVANLDSGTNIGTAVTALESSDLTYDETNNLWIWVGRSTTKGVVYTATSPTSTWTLRLTFTTDTDAVWLATNPAGVSVCGGATESYYSTNGTTWTGATTDAPAANNAVWSESLGLFVLCSNAAGNFCTTADGVNWYDMTSAEGVPTIRNLVHCDKFVFAWDIGAVSTNGATYYNIYAFHTAAADAQNFSYQKLGTAWNVASTPFNDIVKSIYRCGQGKLIFPYYNATPANTTYLAVARYGADDAY